MIVFWSPVTSAIAESRGPNPFAVTATSLSVDRTVPVSQRTPGRMVSQRFGL